MFLYIISILFVLSGVVAAAVIFADEYIRGNRQTMSIMNTVWILTGLWAGGLGLWAYYRFGRQTARKSAPEMDMKMDMPMDMPMKMDMSADWPMWQSVTLSALHCGAGCSIADILGEWFLFFVPLGVFWGWGLEYVLALGIGVFFQYATIRAMQKISPSDAYAKAFKADFWSLTSWQIGMYGWMAIVIFGFGMPVDRLSWQFWFMMQIAMMCGFLAAYPTNKLLIKLGVKKAM